MNREKLLEILNSKQLDISIFIEYAKDKEKVLSDELIRFIQIAHTTPYVHRILEAYRSCLDYFIKKLEVNHIVEKGEIINYY